MQASLPRTETEMVRLLVETAKTRFVGDVLAAARLKRLTRNEVEVIERRVLASLDDMREAEHEFPFDVHRATDDGKKWAREFMRVVRPPEWR